MEFMHSPDDIPKILEMQVPSEIAGIQIDWSSVCGTMADGEKHGRNAPHARRLRALRAVMGYDHSQGAFAKFLDLSLQRYNNFENGIPLSLDAAQTICRKVPGMTLDWLYRDLNHGMPVKMASDLQAALGALGLPEPEKVTKTSPRGSKRRGGPSSRKKPSTS